jgi:Uma2 family endonuclease
MSQPALRKATYQDVLEAPDDHVAELIGGQLHVHPRPASRHARSSSALGGLLDGPFDRGQGGPGGWIILDEPELHLGGDVLVPDLAGWRRTTLPELPDAAFLTVSPDWVAEVLSPATQRTDRTLKVPLYRAQRVAHVWLVDPTAQTVEVYRLHVEGYLLVGSYGGESLTRIEPFDAIEFDVGALWRR